MTYFKSSLLLLLVLLSSTNVFVLTNARSANVNVSLNAGSSKQRSTIRSIHSPNNDFKKSSFANVLLDPKFRCGSLDYRYFVAGGTCAAISHGITTPIDVVKTRMQSEPDVYNKGMLAATASIIATDGVSALLAGLGPTIIGYAVEGAMKFGVYEICKPVMTSLLANVNGKKATAFLLSSVVAGAVAAILLCPMESARIRVVTDPDYKGMNTVDTLARLVKEDGVFKLFSGIWAMLAKQVPYTMGKQVSFDIFASLFYAMILKHFADSVTKDDIKWGVSVAAAFIASIFACISSQPGDMILTATYKGSSDKSFVGVLADIYNKAGVAGFFTGTGARLVHVSSIITTQLVIYDVVKQALGLPATGSH